jgi:tetratricopeptide (TPR) repeat protein
MIKLLSIALLLFSILHAAPKAVSAYPHLLEDTFSLYALDAQIRQKHHRAAEFFSEAYKQTAKKEYLYQSLKMLEQSNDIKTFSKKSAEALKQHPEDEILKRFVIIALLKEGQYAQASQKALLQSEVSKKAPDYLLYGEARLKLGDYAGAVSAFKNAYAINYDETIAERIALIQYTQLGEKNEAIKFLKEHSSIHGVSQIIGKRLGSLYADSGALEDASAMYEQIYDTFGDSAAAEEAMKIYLFQKEFSKLTQLLEKSQLNDPLLLDLYVRIKEFTKASALAQKLYEKENDPIYLAQSSIFKYEGSKERNDPVLIQSVIEGLKKASKDLEEPLYLNYLGYLMIDHDVNVREGMEYVRRALVKQPDSPFYIDSLAWGHYKQGECAEALRLIKQVESMIGTEEQEVRDHLKAIEACKTKENN